MWERLRVPSGRHGAVPGHARGRSGGDPPEVARRGGSGTTPVAILSTATFSAPARVVLTSLTFGRTGDEASFKKRDTPRDVNGDGRLDLLCHFTMKRTGFKLGDTLGELRGLTVGGAPFAGRDRVTILKK